MDSTETPILVIKRSILAAIFSIAFGLSALTMPFFAEHSKNEAIKREADRAVRYEQCIAKQGPLCSIWAPVPTTTGLGRLVEGVGTSWFGKVFFWLFGGLMTAAGLFVAFMSRPRIEFFPSRVIVRDPRKTVELTGPGLSAQLVQTTGKTLIIKDEGGERVRLTFPLKSEYSLVVHALNQHFASMKSYSSPSSDL